MRPIWTHGADGKPNRKIWIERVDLGDKIAADHKALFGDIDEKIRRTHAARTRIIKRFDHLNLEGLEHLAELLDWLDDEQLDDMFPGLRSRTPQR